jgi:tRNA(adenine34) deaminase
VLGTNMENEKKINEIWEICLDLAIEGYNNGSMGIAAVTTNSTIQILSTGRSFVNEKTENKDIISNSVISHAETNALHRLKQDGRHQHNLIIFTTVEPCPMCIGAIGMSRVTKIIVGSKDPYAGSILELERNPYLNRLQKPEL